MLGSAISAIRARASTSNRVKRAWRGPSTGPKSLAKRSGTATFKKVGLAASRYYETKILVGRKDCGACQRATAWGHV